MFGRKRKTVAQMLPISPKMLAGVVLACILIALFLLPDEGTIFNRHLRDQDWEKAYADLQAMTGDQRAKNPEHYDLWDIRLRRRMMEPGDIEGATALFMEALQYGDRYGFSREFMIEIEQLFPKTLAADTKTHLAEQTYKILRPYFSKLPSGIQSQYHEVLAKRALGEANPRLAASIYYEWWKRNIADKNATFHFITLARQSALPDLALQAMQHYEATLSEPIYVHDRQLAGLKIQLLRENSKVHEAKDLLQAMYDVSDDETKRSLQGLLEELKRETGSAPAITLADIVKQANKEPDNLGLWREVAKRAGWENQQELARAAFAHIVKKAPRDGQSAFRLGQMMEWNSQPNQAFDYYLIALDRGVKEALDRLLALNPGLYRDIEMAQAIEKAGAQVDVGKHGHTLARMFSKLTEFDKASYYYELMIIQKGEDHELLREYGLMKLDLGHLDEALELYSRAEAVDGLHVPTLISIAEAEFRAGPDDAAHQTHTRIHEQDPNRRQLENYMRLAESMGRIEESAEALQNFLNRTQKAKSTDYEKLAYFYSVIGNRQGLETALRKSLELFPDDERLRMQLLYSYSDSKQHDQALGLLETFPNLTANTNLTTLYINLLSEAKRYSDVERFITTNLDGKMVNQLNLEDLLASIYYETGNTNATMGLYRRRHERNPSDTKIAMTYAQLLLDAKRQGEALNVLEAIPEGTEPRAMKIAAQLYAQDKNYERALHYQKGYLRTDPKDSGRDWGFFGDLLNERGNPAGAKQAYRRAIDEMLNTLAHIARTNAPNAAAN